MNPQQGLIPKQASLMSGTGELTEVRGAFDGIYIRDRVIHNLGRCYFLPERSADPELANISSVHTTARCKKCESYCWEIKGSKFLRPPTARQA